MRILQLLSIGGKITRKERKGTRKKFVDPNLMKADIRELVIGCLIAATAIGVSGTVSAQNVMTPVPKPAPTARPSAAEPPAKQSPKYDRDKYQAPPEPPRTRMYGGDTYERLIAVSPDVNLALCVAQSNLRVNGWNRNEVRVYVKDGGKMKFHVRDKNEKDGKPNWVTPVPFDPKHANKTYPDCIWGDYIEIDLPMTASLEIKGTETEATIDDVRKVYIKGIGGNITVRNATGGVTALTYEGDVTVEGSTGQMNLETTSGNITAFQLTPAEIGDRFKAKTGSGAIFLQSVTHRQTEVTSISGSVAFTGEIRNGGSYNLSTTNGSIRMTLPASTACQLLAVYGSGNFVSEIPFKLETENLIGGPLKKVAGKIGGGSDAVLKLTANNGSIGIKKN